VNRVLLWRALRGVTTPKDPTLLARYFQWRQTQRLESAGMFTLYPPQIFRVGDQEFMRTVAEAIPTAVRLVDGGLEVLQPIEFGVSSLNLLRSTNDLGRLGGRRSSAQANL
jgi:hypothetical protein